MGTYTAQILVGRPHQNHGGLSPEPIAQVFLSENDKSCWVMHSIGRGAPASRRRIDLLRWIPESPKTILEDGLLFVALHVMRHEDLFAQAPRELTALDTPRVCLGEIDSERLVRLREVCRNYNFGGQGETALILSAFEGSSILSQLDILAKYQFDCEVLTPKFSRTYSAWKNETIITGSLH